MFRTLTVVPVVLAALLAGAQPATALTCAAQGKPSFVAERTVSAEGRVVSRSVVYVSPRWGEREERRINGREEVVLALKDGTYIFDEARGAGIMVPPPQTAAPRQRDIVSSKVGANTQYVERVPGDDGSTGVGEVLLCSPDGVPLRREYVGFGEQRQLQRFVMEHSNVQIRNLPQRMFQVPDGVKISKPRP